MEMFRSVRYPVNYVDKPDFVDKLGHHISRSGI